jgi:peptidoglycan/LPS O-acetylase OafA/YrhL
MVRVAESIGMGEGALRFTIVSLSSLLLFAVFFALAIANVTRSEVHKRLMVLAMIPLMHAAMARLFMKAFAPPDAIGPPPVFVAVPPGLFVDLLIVVAIIFDWRTRGRPHPVYLIGGAALVAVQIAIVPLSATPAWLAIATWIRSLAG